MTSTATLEKLSAEDFSILQAWLKGGSAIALSDEQRSFAEKALYPLLWKHKVATFHELCSFLFRPKKTDLQADVMEALTCKSTRFYRDSAAFEHLRSVVLPQLMQARAASRELRLWSAGCSTGQEAYSLAMLVASLPELAGWTVNILATDVSKGQIDRARHGIYTRDEVSHGLPAAQLTQYFQQDGMVWTARPELKARIQFQVLRLDQCWAPMPSFDLVLLRNVLSTMELGLRGSVLHNVYEQLAADGVLMLGAQESNELSAQDSAEEAKLGFFRRSAMTITRQAA